jgi:hypothetical protein
MRKRRKGIERGAGAVARYRSETWRAVPSREETAPLVSPPDAFVLFHRVPPCSSIAIATLRTTSSTETVEKSSSEP